MKKILLQIFATAIGWLVITLVAAIVFGCLSATTTDDESLFYFKCFLVAIAYPLGLIFVQILNPIFVKRGIKWGTFLAWLIAPAFLIRLVFEYETMTAQNGPFVFWFVFVLVACGGSFTFKQVFNIK